MFDYEESFYVEKEIGVPARKVREIISMPVVSHCFIPAWKSMHLRVGIALATI